MGKKSYDSSSGMSKGGGGPGAKTSPKSGMPMATDTKTGVSEKYTSANVVGSRLNKGGDKKFKGTRGGKKSGNSMPY